MEPQLKDPSLAARCVQISAVLGLSSLGGGGGAFLETHSECRLLMFQGFCQVVPYMSDIPWRSFVVWTTMEKFPETVKEVQANFDAVWDSKFGTRFLVSYVSLRVWGFEFLLGLEDLIADDDSALLDRPWGL